eukprot:Awhi_evm3s14741
MSTSLTNDVEEAPLTQGSVGNFKFQFNEAEAAQMRALNLTEEQQAGFAAFFNSFLRSQPARRPPGSKPAKIKDPDTFHGANKKLRIFLSQLNLTFSNYAVSSDMEKKTIAATYLRGAALDWFINLETELMKPTQTNSCSQYVLDFNRYKYISKLDSVALSQRFYVGLKDKIKDILSSGVDERPTDLIKLQDLSIKIDNRLFNRERERRRRTAPASAPAAAPAPAPVPSSSNAMEIDNASLQPRKLTSAQRQHRLDNNLCLYCESNTHVVENCPKVQAKEAKKRRLPLPTSVDFNALQIPFRSAKLVLAAKVNNFVKSEVFIDNGCTGVALIDVNFVLTHNLPTVRLKTPIPVKLSDGSISNHGIEMITKPISLRIGGHSEKISFFVTKLDNYPLVLGIPWLQKHNPSINWSKMSVSFDSSCCRNHTNSKNKVVFSESAVGAFNYYSAESVVESDLIEISPLSSLSVDPLQPLFVCSVVENKEYAKSTVELDDRGVPLKYSEFSDVFANKDEDNVKTKLPPHRPYDLSINLVNGHELPKSKKIYPLAAEELKALKEYIDKALANGWISPSTSPIGAACFFVKKPNGGLRLCVDYRDLNNITEKNNYPLPLIDQLLNNIAGAEIFTRLDLPDAYHLVRIKDGDEWKTAFRCPYGLFEYNVVSFGLSNAPAVFQSFMNDIFHEFLDDFLVIYLDDLLIFSKDKSKHDENVRKVLSVLREHDLCANPSKCSFDVTNIDFMGYLVSPDGVAMDPSKVDAVLNWSIPKNKKQLQSFLGFANYYRRFIKNFSLLAKPLTKLVGSKSVFSWTEAQTKAFDLLKEKFVVAPILRHFDPDLPILLETDASQVALGAVLSNIYEDGPHPVAFLSKQFNSTEINYHIPDKELLAIVASFKHWRHFLLPAQVPVTVLTDHLNLLSFTQKI